MRKIILILLLAGLSGNVMAEWVVVSPGGDSTGYIETKSIRKVGTIVRLWELTDYQKPQPLEKATFLSMKAYVEYDCEEAQYRPRALSAHSGPMGTGGVVYTFNSDAQWSPVPPESNVEITWKFACKKK